MTETKLKRRLFNFQLKSYSTYLVPTGILLFGVFFGALAAGVLYSFEDPVLDALVRYYDELVSEGGSSVFISSFVSLSAYLACCLMLSFFAFGKYLLYLVPLGRGMGYGLVAGAICCFHQLNGFLYTVAALAPGMLLSSGALIFYVLEGIRFSGGTWTGRKSVKSQSKRLMIYTLIVFIAFTLSSLFDLLLSMLFRNLLL